MRNKDFFYLQYNKLNWHNQKKTGLNVMVNNFIIDEIISQKESEEIKVFDIGFGIGLFFKMLADKLTSKFQHITLDGCEPSEKNYKQFQPESLKSEGVDLNVQNTTFLNSEIDTEFDFITAIYVFPHLGSGELEMVVQKIYTMLKGGGKFILVVANEEYLKEKLQSQKDLFIERNKVEFNGKEYEEVLHYSEIPQIGTVIDYNREEQFYIDLFEQNNFQLSQKDDLNDSGFIGTVFVFMKN